MRADHLKQAQFLLSARKYAQVVKLLEPEILNYRSSYLYFYILGTAFFYLGDLGGAEVYYKRAARIYNKSSTLICAQAVMYLRKAEVQTAIEYFLEAQEYDSENKIARMGLDYIRKYTNTDIDLGNFIYSKKIRKLYPKIPFPRRFIILPIAFLCIFALGIGFFKYKQVSDFNNMRGDLSAFSLTIDDKKNVLTQDTSSSVFHVILTSKDIIDSYQKAQMYFQKYRDNFAQVEINRILNSNASYSIREKARLLMEYLTEPSFDTFKDNFSYKTVQETPWLYLDCWVSWSGRLTNVEVTDTEYQSDFLVGYESMRKVDGVVQLVLKQPVQIDSTLPIEVLARVTIRDKKLVLEGKSVYQPLQK